MSSPKILLVDDEVNILNALKRLLFQENFDITVTDSPFEALHLASKEKFAIVMSDHRMPHMEGTLLLQKIKEISPASVRILLTGYADLNAATSAINEGEVYRFLSKPWDDNELVKTLKQAVEQFESGFEQKEQNTELKKKNQVLTEKNIEQVFENRRLSEELDRSYLTSINTLAQSIKVHDAGLWHHSLAVKTICQKIGKIIDLPRDRASQLEVAALLHDIGKIGIPATLNKHEKLLLIQGHPFNGYSIVSQIPRFQEAAMLIRHHHEHFDGTGYPDGLKGTDIPAGARIIAVVDAYANMKKGHPFVMDASYQEAMQSLDSQAGERFDPDAIKLLKECIASETNAGTNKEKSPMRQETTRYWQQAVMKDKAQVLAQGARARKGPPGRANPSAKGSMSSSLEEGFLFEQTDAFLTDLADIEIVPYTEAKPLEPGHSPLSEKTPPATFPTPELPKNRTSAEADPALGVSDKPPLPEENTLPQEVGSITPTPRPQQIPDVFQQAIDKSLVESAKAQEPTSTNDAGGQSAPRIEQNRKNIYKSPYGDTKRTYQEVLISPDSLCAGMVLSRDLKDPQGIKLLRKGTIIHPRQLDSIKSYLKRNASEYPGIYILRPYKQ